MSFERIEADPTMWGIHGGRTGDADTLFFQHSRVALGWPKVGDLGSLPPDREAFKAQLINAYPDKKPGAVPVEAGQLFRFVHEIEVGDFIAYPSRVDRNIHLGRVVGAYAFDAQTEPAYPHSRNVSWLRSVPRTNFSQGALYEIGSAMSLFQIKNYVDEYAAVLKGESAQRPPVDQDETVAEITKDIEENTRDFVLKRLSQDLKGLPFEAFVTHLLECMGYHARLTRRNEPSVDVIAHKDQLGIEPPIIKVQVKSGDGAISDRDVSALYGKLSGGEYGLFITLGTFSPVARSFEQGKSNLRLIDGDEFVALLFDYYERFDARHKGLLPLRRVYVPAVEPEDVG